VGEPEGVDQELDRVPAARGTGGHDLAGEHLEHRTPPPHSFRCAADEGEQGAVTSRLGAAADRRVE